MIWLISKAWIDPLENYNAHGYKPLGYFEGNEDEVIQYCKDAGTIPSDSCWSITMSYPNGMPNLQYKLLKALNR
jgi:hypothetical protein